MSKNPHVAPVNVLVVEDDQSITRMLRFSLKASGFTIAEVATGGEALIQMEKEPPDAVLLDLGLPDGQGEMVLKRLQQSPNGRPAWIAISALGRQEATRRYGPLNQHFMAKPFDPWELIEILEKMIVGVEQLESTETVLEPDSVSANRNTRRNGRVLD